MAELRYLPSNRGFSLLEVIITVAILSVGIVTVVQTFSYSSRLTGLASDMSRAVFLAEDKIQELEFKEKRNLISKEPIEVSDKKDKFNWQYSLNLEPDLKLYKLNLEVSWLRLNRQERIKLTTYLRE